jgi:hypothetical protein
MISHVAQLPVYVECSWIPSQEVEAKKTASIADAMEPTDPAAPGIRAVPPLVILPLGPYIVGAAVMVAGGRPLDASCNQENSSGSVLQEKGPEY